MPKKGYAQPKPCGASTQGISEYAEQIAEALELRPGSELEPVVMRLRGTIEYLPLIKKDSRRASITVEKGGEFIIRLLSVLFPLQKRFSIAHELGHLFLHSRYGDVALEAFYDTESESERVEDEAHEFACAFLMPTKTVCDVVRVVGRDSTKIAAMFMVPEPIARQRIVDVGC